MKLLLICETLDAFEKIEECMTYWDDVNIGEKYFILDVEDQEDADEQETFIQQELNQNEIFDGYHFELEEI